MALRPMIPTSDVLNEGTPNVPDLPTLQERDRVTSQMLGNVPVIADPRMPRDTVAQVNPLNGTVTLIGTNGETVTFDAKDVQFSADPVGMMGGRLREHARQMYGLPASSGNGTIHGTLQPSYVNWDAIGQLFGIERTPTPEDAATPQPKYTLEDLPEDDFDYDRI